MDLLHVIPYFQNDTTFTFTSKKDSKEIPSEEQSIFHGKVDKKNWDLSSFPSGIGM